MKKSLISIIAVVCAALSLTACGNSDDSSSAANGTISVETSSSQTESETTTEQTTVTEETTTQQTTAETTAKTTVKTNTTTTEQTTVPTTKATTKATTVTTTAPTTKATTTTTPKPVTTTQAQAKQSSANGKFTKNDAAASFNGTVVTIDAKFDSIKKSLGNPDSKSENVNCLRGSAGFTYIYSNMTVSTYKKNNTEYVEDIMVMSDGKAKTSKNISVGSKKSDIITAYGKAKKSDETSLTYTDGQYNIMFYIDGGKVIGFHIYAE